MADYTKVPKTLTVDNIMARAHTRSSVRSMIRTESPLWRDATFSSRIKTSHVGIKPDDAFAGLTSRRSSKASTLPMATPSDGRAISRSESAKAPTCTQKSTTATSITKSSQTAIEKNDGSNGSAQENKEKEVTDEEWIEQLGKKLKKTERVKKDHVDGILDHYKGERTEKLIKHGLGNYTYKNKFFTYEGEWFNGVKHGRGKITMKDGSFYEGTFRKGEMTGRGVKVWENGTKTYVGYFKQGKMHGEGKIMSTNGDFYSGGFAENLRQGYGESKDMEGLYRGMHEKGLRQGQGMFIYEDTATYVGDWLKNKPHGDGVFKNKDGFVITGQFTDGKPSVWPTKIELNETGPIKVFKGEYFNLSFRYVNQNGESTQCYEGFKCKMTGFFKKPSLPKSKRNNLPDMVKIEENLQIVKTPFFKAISYPICNFANYVHSLHYPYNLVDDESLRMKNEPLQNAFDEIVSLKYFLSSLENSDTQMLMDKGLKFPEDAEHESNKWPLPIVDEYVVDTTGSGHFSKIALPDADRPEMPYEPFVIDSYLQEYEKNKRKHGVYFGEKPKDVTYDALGRAIVDDSDKEEEDEESIYPGLTVGDLELPVEKQLIKILFNGYARKGLYCIKLEDIAPESVYTWFSLPRPEPAYIQVKVVEYAKRVKSKHRSSSRGSGRQRTDEAAPTEQSNTNI